MSNLKRVVSMLLAVAMVLSMSTIVTFADEVTTTTTNQEAADAVVSAAAVASLASLPNDDVQYADAYKFDYSLGLFEMLEDGYWQKQQVTRADFATIVAKMLKANTAGYPRYGVSPYTDLDESSVAYPAICYLTEIGILNGDGNSQFRPNDPILVNEASKMIMCALGYQPACETTNGGFPNGYTSFALRQGIYNDVNLSYTDSMTAMQMSKMVRNAMEAYLMDTVVYNSDGTSDVIISDTKTLLSETYKIYIATGNVEATYFSTLVDGEVDLENEVLVNVLKKDANGASYYAQECYQYADTVNAEAFLGYEIDFYYMEDVSGYRRNFISYMEPKGDRNNEYVVSFKDITSLTNNKLVYTQENGRDKTFTIDGNTAVSKNGKPYTLTDAEYSLTESNGSVKEGNVKIITNQSNAKASAVIIEEQIDGIFERYNKTNYTVVFQNSAKYNGKNPIKYESLNHTVLTLDGVEIKPEDLVKNDVITYTVSDDGSYVRGYVSRDSISGTIDRTTTEEFTTGTANVVRIDETEYYVSAYCVKDLNSGFTSDFQLTYDGRILGTNANTSSSGNYAYLIDMTEIYDGMEVTFGIKVLDKYGNVARYTSLSKVTTNILSDTGELLQRTASDIVDSGKFAESQVIVFDTNSAGKVTAIYKAIDYTSSDDLTELTDPDSLDFGMYYNGTGRYSNGLIGTCAIDDSTIVFNVPFSDRNRDEDYSLSKKEELSNGSYTAQAYDVKNGIANVLVIKGKEPAKVSDTAAVMFVDERAEVWDEELQQKVIEISGWSKGEYVSVKVDDDVTMADGLNKTDVGYDDAGLRSADEYGQIVGRGDLIQYELGSNGYVYTYRVLFNFDKRTADQKYFNVNQDQSENVDKVNNDDLFVLFGEVKSVYDFYLVESISDTLRKFYRAFPTQNINLYIYDTAKQELTLGDSTDIEVGNQLVIRTKNIDSEIDMMIIQ